MSFFAGAQIYKYKLEQRIGGGNFGEVWTAIDMALDAKVAVKLLDKTQYSIDERLLEAQIGNRLQHSNVVNIKGADIFKVNGIPIVAISMPYYSNGSVLSRLNSLNFLDLQEALKCLVDILRGLEYLHENGYYHCDIKPNNILVGDRQEYLLSDYGITCYSPDHHAVTPRQSYLPHISPETLSKDIYDERTDIYQLGLTAFRLINGISEIRVDFEKDQIAFNAKVLQGKIITPDSYKPYVPLAIRRIINKATNPDPDERYQTSLEMRRAFERVKLIGNCTGDAAGNLILLQANNSYRYEIIPMPGNKFSLYTYKQNIKSGSENHYLRYCIKNLTSKQLHKKLQDLCLEIISG